MAGSTPISSALAKSSAPIRCFVSGPSDHWCARRPLALALALMAMGCSSCRRRSCAAGSSRRAIADTPADRPWRSQRPSRPSLSATQGRVGEQRCLAPAPQAPCSRTEHTGPARQENGWRFRTHNRTSIRAAIAVISMRKVQFIAMLLERNSGIAVVQNTSKRMPIAEEPDPVRRQWQRPTACRSAHRPSSL